MAELTLRGCAPTPIAGYLKALGVLRLFAAQKREWVVRGAWQDEGFTLASPQFAEDEQTAHGQLETFLLNDYRPTPIVAPWNDGSGFYPKDNSDALKRIATGNAERLSAYRTGIDFCREQIKQIGLMESPKNEQKNRFLAALRGQAPESLLDWFDAAATRRLESSDPGALAYPFTVRPIGTNNGGLSSSDEGQARAEIWMPLWERPATAGEMKRLLSEAGHPARQDGQRRAGLCPRHCRPGGNRGITAFQRYGFPMRSGKAYLATPLSRFQVRSNPQAQLIDDLESGGFLDRLKRALHGTIRPRRASVPRCAVWKTPSLP